MASVELSQEQCESCPSTSGSLGMGVFTGVFHGTFPGAFGGFGKSAGMLDCLGDEFSFHGLNCNGGSMSACLGWFVTGVEFVLCDGINVDEALSIPYFNADMKLLPF